MKKHLEYQDEKSHKFWEIEIKDNNYTVTYGKIGTKGQSKTKNFDTGEEAKKDAKKITKSKMKKGYVTVSNKEKVHKTLTFKEANKSYKLDYEIVDNMDTGDSVLVFEEDIIIEDDFLVWAKKIKKIEHPLLLFTGNLIVNGDIELYDFNVIVLGNLTCYFLEVNEFSFNLIVGDAIIKYAISCGSNDTYTDILGETKVPFYYNNDNYSTINQAKNTICLYEYEPDHNDFDFVIKNENMSKLINRKYLEKNWHKKNQLFFNFELFLKALKQGKSPFINIADKDFSLEFEKEDFLKKIKGE